MARSARLVVRVDPGLLRRIDDVAGVGRRSAWVVETLGWALEERCAPSAEFSAELRAAWESPRVERQFFDPWPRRGSPSPSLERFRKGGL